MPNATEEVNEQDWAETGSDAIRPLEADVLSSFRLTLHVLFWAALAYVKVGGGEVYVLCRSQAWEIISNTRFIWNVQPKRKKRQHVRCFLSQQPPLSSLKSFLFLFSPVFQIFTQSIFTCIWRDRTWRAALLHIHHAVYWLFSLPLLPNFTQVTHTHTHLSVFKAHKLGCLI